MTEPNKITLKYENSPDFDIVFDPLEVRNNKWMQQLVLLPWTSPSRLIGFVHPEAEKDIGVKSFVLFGAFAYMSQLAMQPVNAGQIQIVEGPKAIVPVDMVAPLDVVIGSTCASWAFVRDQGDSWKTLVSNLMLQTLMPPALVKPAGVPLIKTP